MGRATLAGSKTACKCMRKHEQDHTPFEIGNTQGQVGKGYKDEDEELNENMHVYGMMDIIVNTFAYP